MPHENDRPGRRHRVEDREQVTAELVDRGGLRGAPSGAAVRALVVEDQATGAVLGERLALVVPDGQLLDVAVDEDHRERGVGRTHLLDVQTDPVLRGDLARPVRRQGEERLAGVGVRAQAGTADGVPLGAQAHRGSEGDDAERRAEQTALARQPSFGHQRPPT